MNGLFRAGENGVREIVSTKDGKIHFVDYAGKTLCVIESCSGQNAVYPLFSARLTSSPEYVIMDLDGTSVESEEFWVECIRKTVGELIGENVAFTAEDIPFVSGHTTAEHLDYALKKYGGVKVASNASEKYLEVSRKELERALNTDSGEDKIRPSDGLKDFLLTLKNRGVKIGLASSGLFYKAIPEIETAFAAMKLGDPLKFYDSIITGGVEKEKGKYSTLGELAAKPHPWLYKELVVNGLNCVDPENAVVIEDSASGVLAARLAGYAVIGLTTGNIDASGLAELCSARADSLNTALKILFPDESNKTKKDNAAEKVGLKVSCHA